MNKKKFVTALTSAALGICLVAAPVAPANAIMVTTPAAPGYIICKWWPVFC